MTTLRSLRLHLLALLAFATLALPIRADTISFSLIPVGGNVVGLAGTTVGWGYSITNNSSIDWFASTNLNSDSFSNGSPALLFDFPNVPPGATVSEAFDAINSVGLFDLTWGVAAPGAFVNHGRFILSGQWYDGDPLNGGSFIADAIDGSASYAAAVEPSSTSTPEPSGLAMVFSALALVTVLRIRDRVFAFSPEKRDTARPL
jgi:hypothetical protein